MRRRGCSRRKRLQGDCYPHRTLSRYVLRSFGRDLRTRVWKGRKYCLGRHWCSGPSFCNCSGGYSAGFHAGRHRS